MVVMFIVGFQRLIITESSILYNMALKTSSFVSADLFQLPLGVRDATFCEI